MAIQIVSMEPTRMSHFIIVQHLSRAEKTCSRAKMDDASIRFVFSFSSFIGQFSIQLNDIFHMILIRYFRKNYFAKENKVKID